MNLEIAEHTDRDSFDDSEYLAKGIAATVKHHTENGDGSSRHAILIGDDVIIVESTDDE